MKGLPLAYNKDMQEDKEALFGTVDTVAACLAISVTVLRNIRVNESQTRAAAERGFLNATELADYLARKGMPFREAHEAVGRIVRHAIERGCELEGLPLDELKSFAGLIEADVFEAISLERALASKNQIGGTAPARVAEALKAAREGQNRER
jgi:argininosuccinate lyase